MKKLVSLALVIAIVLSFSVIAGATQVAPYSLGDVNGDGFIDSADALEILKYEIGLPNVIEGNPRALAAADIFGNGVVDSRVALEIMKFEIGLPSVFDGKNSSPVSASVGDKIWFGGLSWIVLDVQDGMALIISEDILENQKYHSEWAEITWEHSSPRAYLNGEFYNSFSSAEQGRIVETTIINSNNPHTGTPGGNDTIDKIFLLSIDEADNYKEIINDVYSRWWLRSPGYFSIYAAFVDETPFNPFNAFGWRVDHFGGVRPALWLNL
ncbi:MAG: dockerin type I repeat-containing protein [Oscillospiraceae bacterium]|jgi:hypothetical protein|nr:dockerin type I repeat-containing protein [Oscillospiraceae bacterium]